MCDKSAALTQKIEKLKERIKKDKQALEEAKKKRHQVNGTGPFEMVECTNAGWAGEPTCGKKFPVRDLTPVVISEYDKYSIEDRYYTKHVFRCPGCGALNRLIFHRAELWERIKKFSEKPTEYIES